MATKKKGVSSSTGGIKTDALPESPFHRRDRSQDAEPAPDGLTVGGKPIEASVRHLIPYANTDQGIAEREAKPHATASVTRDPHSKKLERFRDSKEAMEPWENADPMQEIMDAHLPAGHRGKFLSDRVIARQGLRGWKVVGSAPKLGELTFASMPEAKADARNRTYQAKGQEKVVEIHNEFTEKQERRNRDAGMRPESLKAQREGLDSGLHSTRGSFEE